MSRNDVTVWLAWRSVRDDPRGILAIAVTSAAATAALTLVLTATFLASEALALSASQRSQGDFGPVVSMTALVATVAVIRVQALMGRDAERDGAILLAAGLRPVSLVRIAHVTTGAGSLIGAVCAVPVVAVLAGAVLPLYVGASAAQWGLVLSVALAWSCSAILVTAVGSLAAGRVASLAAVRLPARVLRGDDADRAEAAPSRGWRVTAVLAIWVVFVLPVVGAVVLWDALLALSSARFDLFDATDLQAFEMFTPTLRVIALHSTMVLGAITSLVLVFPLFGPRLLRRWTHAVPVGRGLVWRLVRARTGLSTVASMSAATMAGLVIGLVAAQQSTLELGSMLGALPDGSSAAAWSDMALALGPAAAVALTGASAVRSLSGPRRDPDWTILAAHGAPPSLGRLVILVEAVVIIVTAAVPVLIAVTMSTALTLAIATAGGTAVAPHPPNPTPVLAAAFLAVIALIGGAALSRIAATAPRTRSATARATARRWRR
ncbi:hypothetical protein SOM11_05375 [Frigoribacterium sp. CFBP9039]|uniref:hypothetical protein n=1 Tax=Frigoribacterium sp. CFBP9029 TaxID=3096541 RepID=UPI002A6B191B|nr:hypothetical protein [Frigoribacterium sp. CFBP9039]MDY0945413.1 hypothetical protein [Frigoribacterium sp. CFBP9039]